MIAESIGVNDAVSNRGIHFNVKDIRYTSEGKFDVGQVNDRRRHRSFFWIYCDSEEMRKKYCYWSSQRKFFSKLSYVRRIFVQTHVI